MCQKRSSYSLAQKSEIIQFALENQIKNACLKYNVHKSMLSRWIKNMDTINSADPSRKRLIPGNGLSKRDVHRRKSNSKSAKRSRQRNPTCSLKEDGCFNENSFSSSISTAVTSDTAIEAASGSLYSEIKKTKSAYAGYPTVSEAAFILWLFTQRSVMNARTIGSATSFIWTK